MSKSFFIQVIFLFFFATALGQSKPEVIYSDAEKFISAQPFANGIVKLVYSPKNYSKTENVSDAVIAKPAKSFLNKPQVLAANLIAKDGWPAGIWVFSNASYNGFTITMQRGETIAGGGERALPLNRRGYKFNLYNNPWYGYAEGADNLNYSVPFFISNKGYGLFFDNASKGFADIGTESENQFKVGFVSGEINVYVIPGKDYKDILSKYHQLTGTQPLPPKWALGNFMSRFGYSSRLQTENILYQMQEQKIPIDAIIFDLFWFGDSIKGTMGNLDWVNKQKWPDPKSMISNFRKQGINTILITEPFVLKTSLNYNNSEKYHAVDKQGNPFVLTDFYFGHGGLIDIFRKDAKDWFWTFHQKEMKNGVEAWWGDLGEPEKHPAGLYHNLKDLGYKRLFEADEVHNIYGHNWTKMLYQKYAQYYPTKRLFSLNRSGFAGSQRYGIFPWSGDVSRNWSGLRAQLPIMLGMSMSGVPYIHADAGGFAGGEGDNELYVRWLQFASFTPVFRPHGTALFEIDKNAYSFPSEPALISEPYRDYARHAIIKRYQLTPYNYTLAYRQATTGAPLVAPLTYYYPQDSNAALVQNQYFWGDRIMVAPVLQKGAKNVGVYLPRGEWYRLGDNEKITSSGESKNFEAPIFDMPVFVKAGTILPMVNKDEFRNIADCKNDSLIVHYYAGTGSSEFTLYDDDGVSKNSIDTKKYELITWKAQQVGEKLSVQVIKSGNGYKGKPTKRFIFFEVHGAKYSKALVNGKGVDFNNNMLAFTFSGAPVKIELFP